jgi:hypothetical protein
MTMRLASDRRTDLALIVLLNAVPLAGVLWWHWPPFPLMVLFWFENVIVGLAHALRLLLAPATQLPAGRAGAAIGAGFFALHFGLFCLVHGVLIVGLFARHAAGPTLESHLQVLIDPLRFDPQLRAAALAVAGLGLARLFGELLRGERSRWNDPRLPMQPYGRVILLHVALVAGGLTKLALGAPVGVLTLLVLLKAGYDIDRWRRDGAARRTGAAVA